MGWRRFNNRVYPENYTHNAALNHDEMQLYSTRKIEKNRSTINQLGYKFAYCCLGLSIFVVVAVAVFFLVIYFFGSVIKPPLPPPHVLEFNSKVQKQELQYHSSKLKKLVNDTNNETTSDNTLWDQMYGITKNDRLLNTIGCYMLNVFEEIKETKSTLIVSNSTSANDCRLNENLKTTFSYETQTLQFIMRKQNKKCCFISIDTSQLNNTDLLFPSCVPVNIINEMIEIHLNTSNTSILLDCNTSAVTTLTSHQLTLNAAKENKIQEKIQYWEQYNAHIPSKKLTFSIFTIVIDGLSRIRARLQLPLSLQLLQRFNFSEMKGYHLSQSMSTGNFIPLFTGWPLQKLPFDCKPLDEYNIDTCPFVWRQFGHSKFITVMAGDIPDIVNPVKTSESKHWDYTVDENAANILHHSLPKECNATSPIERILTVMQTILKSNPSTPKFALLWINETTLEDEESAKDLDAKLGEFLLSILNHADVLKNSLIFFATHTPFYEPISENDTGEHRLPTLFARVPENISGYEEVNRLLKQNQNRLVTPFTIHEAYRWFWNHLSPHSSNSTYEETDSLLDTISEFRTCKDAKISNEICACQPAASLPIFGSDEEELGEKMSKRAINYINSVVRRDFNAEDNCTRHEFKNVTMLNKFRLDNGRKLAKFQYVVNFQVVPSNDMFQATFTHFPERDMDDLHLISVNILNKRRTSELTGYCHKFERL